MTGEQETDRLSAPASWLIAPLVLLIRAYQKLVSPLTPPTCRFYPSCSAYALTALRRHGLVRGTWLAARRVLRCHPWNPGGVDHVPPRRATSSAPPSPSGSTESSHPALRIT